MGSPVKPEPSKKAILKSLDLYLLADALQMELQANAGRVTGQQKFSVKVPDLGFKMALDLRVVSSRTTDNTKGGVRELALIVQVRGNLHLLMLDDDEGFVHAFVIDRSDFKDEVAAVTGFLDYFEKRPDKKLAALVTGLISKAKSSYSRDRYQQTWFSPSALA